MVFACTCCLTRTSHIGTEFAHISFKWSAYRYSYNVHVVCPGEIAACVANCRNFFRKLTIKISILSNLAIINCYTAIYIRILTILLYSLFRVLQLTKKAVFRRQAHILYWHGALGKISIVSKRKSISSLVHNSSNACAGEMHKKACKVTERKTSM